MESVLMMTPLALTASSSASADLPLAVGPAISTALPVSVAGSPGSFMSLVATLICNPATPALDSTAVDAARAILPGAQAASWLFEGVAADIPFTATEAARDITARVRAAIGDLPV